MRLRLRSGRGCNLEAATSISMSMPMPMPILDGIAGGFDLVAKTSEGVKNSVSLQVAAAYQHTAYPSLPRFVRTNDASTTHPCTSYSPATHRTASLQTHRVARQRPPLAIYTDRLVRQVPSLAHLLGQLTLALTLTLARQ